MNIGNFMRKSTFKNHKMAIPLFLFYPSILLSTVGVTVAYLWFIRPEILVKWGMKYMLHKTGMKVKYTEGKKYTYCYGERGEKQKNRLSLLLVHGFSASKDMFVPVVKRLPTDIHVIVLDLPGHGGTSVPKEDDSITLEELTENVHEFTELVGLTDQKFHLAGTSMGGVIVALFGIKYVHLLDRLTLVCPAFKTPVPTEFSKEILRGDACRLIPDTVEEMAEMLDSCFYNKKVVPQNRQILKGSLGLRRVRNDFYHRLFDSLKMDMKNEGRLEEEAHNMTCPVQIIWGKQDEIIHVSGAGYLQTILPNVQKVDLLDDCGHSVSFDRSGLFVKCLLEFRGEIPASEQKKQN